MKTVVLSLCLLWCSIPALTQATGSAESSSAATPQISLPASVTTKLEAQPPDQSDLSSYLSYAITLASSDGKDFVIPLEFTVNGQERIHIISPDQIAEYQQKGGKFISLAELLSVINQQIQTINKLQGENASLHELNEKLWKVAMKDTPGAANPPTVVVQQPIQQQPSALEKYMLLRAMFPPAKPYQLPPPVNPNANQIQLQTNCTTLHSGNAAYTNCH